MTNQQGLRTEPSELTSHRRSLDALTGIRFFAAFYVVIFHTRVGAMFLVSGYGTYGVFFQNGFLAVPLFFLLSGFILAYTYRGQIRTRGDHRRFWEARFARLWPVYMVSLLLSSIPSLSFPTPLKMLAAIFMVQSWNPFDLGLAGIWNFVCWTLSAEAFFYLLFPTFQQLVEKLAARFQFSVLILAIALCVVLNTASRTLGYEATGLFRFAPLALCHLPEFFAGVCLGNVFLCHRSANSSTFPSWLFGSGIATWLSVLLTCVMLCRLPDNWTSLVVGSFSLLIFGLAAETTLLSRFLSSPLMVLAGGISYSLYLMQIPVKTWARLVDEHYQFTGIIHAVMPIVLLLCVSLILFKGVEEPARRLIRRISVNLERRIDGSKTL